jgi:hypothetical protein
MIMKGLKMQVGGWKELKQALLKVFMVVGGIIISLLGLAVMGAIQGLLRN